MTDFRKLLSFLPSPGETLRTGLLPVTRSFIGLDASVSDVGVTTISLCPELGAGVVGLSMLSADLDGMRIGSKAWTTSCSSSASASSSSSNSNPCRLSIPVCLTRLKLGSLETIGGARLKSTGRSSGSGKTVGVDVGDAGSGMFSGSTSATV